MNPKGKKFVSLFLVFSLMMLSVNLYANEGRGANLEIWKKDGRLIKGELVAVKENSLLVLDTEGKDVSIDIGDIIVIKIKKKPKVGKGALKGLLIGGGIGALSGGIAGNPDNEIVSNALKTAIFYGGIGALVGAITGAVAGIGKKTFQIEGMTNLEIQRTLDKLRKKARVRDYK